MASNDDEDRAAILARRKRWITLAVAGAVVAESCAFAQPCLSLAIDGGADAGTDAGPDAGADAGEPDAGD